MDALAQLNSALTGRYEVEREIGTGGMATVFLARDLKHDRNVALKMLKPELGAVLGVERFLAEIKVTANLQHPNLLPLFDSGAADGLLFYVMPYVEGESLRARLAREKQLPVDEAVRIASAVASALDYAHRHHVIHRDLKPENILLHEGQPLIADFGIALAVSNAGGARVTQTGISLGTPQYMSPEQATGDRVIDGRSDIYSLAAVTYEMLTGEPPHSGATAQAIIARVLTEHPRSVRASRPNVPEHVELALEHALEKLAADRWSTPGEFADALQGKAAALPARSAESAFASGDPRARRRWQERVRDPIQLALAVLVLVSAAFSIWEWRAAHREEVRTTVRFPLTFPRDVSVASEPGATLAMSPDGRVVAFVGIGAGGVRRLFVRALDDIHARPLPGTEGATQLFFSPDSRWLGFLANLKLQKVPLDGGSVLPLADVRGSFSGASWSPRGVIVMSTENKLVTIPETGGAPRALTKPDTAGREEQQRWPLALADGRTVLYSTWGNGGLSRTKIGVASLDNGRSTILELPGTFPLGVANGFLLYADPQSGSLMAVQFDVGRGRVADARVPVVTNVAITTVGSAQAGMSLDGSLVYQAGTSPTLVVLADAHGATPPLIQEPKSYLYPRFSPEGKRIAITVGSGTRLDVWTYDLASRTTTPLTTDGKSNDRPEWTPDGKRVVFRSTRGGRNELWWRPADLSGAAELLLKQDSAEVFEGVVSPDGRTLVYRIGDFAIWYRRLTGDTVPKPVVTTSSVVVSTPRLSPDGRWVAYTMNETGTYQVFVQPFPGPGARTQASTERGTEPVWARDGRRLIYRNNQQFIAATYTTSPAFAVTSRAVLFEGGSTAQGPTHANYDISPDGTQLLLLKPTEDPQTIIVRDWRDELRARMAAKAPQ